MKKLALIFAILTSLVSVCFSDTGFQNATASDVIRAFFYMAVIMGISYLIWGVIWGVFDNKKDKNDE